MPDMCGMGCVVEYGMGHKCSRFVFIKKSLFSRAMKTKRLEHGTVHSKVN